MEAETFKIFSEFWIVWWLLIIIVISLIYWLKKLIPYLWQTHLEAINGMHDKFSANLDKITDTFLKKVEESEKWHNKHSEKLDVIHKEIIECKQIKK